MWGQLLRWVNSWGQSSPIEPIFFLPNVYYPAELTEDGENRWCEQFLLDKAPGALILRSRENGFLTISAVMPQQVIKHFASMEISVLSKDFYYRKSKISSLGELTQALNTEFPDFVLSVRYRLVSELEVVRIFREQAQLFRPDEMSSSGGDSLKVTQFYQRFGEIHVFCLPGVFYPTSLDGEIPPNWVHAYLKAQEVGACILNPSKDDNLIMYFVDTKNNYTKEITISRIESARLKIKERGVWNGGGRIRTMDELIHQLQLEFPDTELASPFHLVSEIDARRVRFSLGIEHLASHPNFLLDEEIERYFDKIRIISAQLEQEGYCVLKGAQVEEPRLAFDGFSYEKNRVEAWFESSRVSPVTELALDHTVLRENWMLKNILAFFNRIKPLIDDALETSTIQYAKVRSRLIQPDSFNSMLRSFKAFNIDSGLFTSNVSSSSKENDLSAELENICLELESMGQCAIRYVRIEIPGTLETGHTFEKREIEAWLEKNMICPQTAKELQDKSVWENHSLLGPLRILNELEQLLPNLSILLKNLKQILLDDDASSDYYRGILFPPMLLGMMRVPYLPYTNLRMGRRGYPPFLNPSPPLLLTYPSSSPSVRVEESDVDADGTELPFSVESPSPNL